MENQHSQNTNPTTSTEANTPPNKKSHKLKRPIWLVLMITILLIFLFSLGGYFILNQTQKTEPTTSPSIEPVACTQEAMLCPDGKTYVSRQGPKCEFAPCPGS